MQPRSPRHIHFPALAAIAGAAVLLAVFAGLGSFVATNVSGVGGCELIKDLSALPAPFDPGQGPLTIVAAVADAASTVSATIGTTDEPVADISLSAANGQVTGIWNGNDESGVPVAVGTYPLLLRASSGSCTDQRWLKIQVRPSAIPYVELSIGQHLKLGLHEPGTETESGLHWRSSEPGVVEVDAENVLIAHAPGTATLLPVSDALGGWHGDKIEVRVLGRR